MSTPSLGRAPLALLIPAALGATVLALPMLALLLGTDWDLLGEQLGSAGVRDALLLSVLTATAAMIICLVLGVPLAWMLARSMCW